MSGLVERGIVLFRGERGQPKGGREIVSGEESLGRQPDFLKRNTRRQGVD